MGNEQSDRNEEVANAVIQWIPGVNIAYSGVRSAVYAGKGDMRKAGESLASAGANAVALTIAAPGGAGRAVAGGLVGGAVYEIGTAPTKDWPS